nr:15688_t:CDS:2 [Entrophospora candida]
MKTKIVIDIPSIPLLASMLTHLIALEKQLTYILAVTFSPSRKSNYIREFPVFPQLKLLMKGYVYLDKETIGYGTARAAQYGTGEIDRVMNMI